MERPFKCKTCKKGFIRKQNLKTHMLSHTGYQRYKCKICERKFVYRQEFKDHMNIHNGIRPYKCAECSKSFLRASELKTHKNSGLHAGIRPWKCTKCKKKFSQQAHLKAHLRSHTGDKPFKCGVCFKAFTQSSHLNSHMLHHTGEKPHQCTICKLSYRLKTTLNSHMRTHTGERPYKCPHCPKAFTQHTPLTEHIQKFHGDGDQKFPCRSCDKIFLTKNQLQRHEKGSHPEGKFAHICVFCGKGSHIRAIIWDHIRQHIEEKPYFCGYCDKSFLHGSCKKRCERRHKNKKQKRNKKQDHISKSSTKVEKQAAKKLVAEEEVMDKSPFSPPPPVLLKEPESKCPKSNINKSREELNGNIDSESNSIDNTSRDANNSEQEDHSDSSTTSPPSSLSHGENELPDFIADSPPSLDLEVNPEGEQVVVEPETPKAEILLVEVENGVHNSGLFSCNICMKTFPVKAQLNGHIGAHRKYQKGKSGKRINLPAKKSKNPARRCNLVKIKSEPISSDETSSPSLNPSSSPTTEERECTDITVDLKPNLPMIKTETSNSGCKTARTSPEAPLKRKLSKAQTLMNVEKLKAMRNPFKCSKCKYSAACSISLQLHVRLAHEGVQCHQCNFCWKRFPTEIKRIAHHSREHGDVHNKH